MGEAGDGTVVLTWDDPGDATLTGYQVRFGRRRTSLPAWSDDHVIDNSGAATTEHTVGDLTNGREYRFEVRARVDDVPGASASVTATPRACPTITVAGLEDTTVTVGQAVPMTAAATGGTAPYQYTLSVSPETGSGLSIGEDNGSITGTPDAAGTYTVTVTATDADGCMGTGTFTLKVCPVITVAPIDDVTVTAGGNVSRTASATGGCGTITYTMTGAPEDVEIDGTTGVISGLAAPVGAHEVTVIAADEEGNAGQAPFTITVVCPAIGVGGLNDATATVGQVLRMTAAGSGSRASYWYFISSEPAEGITLSIGERDGAITATPSAAGTYTVTVTVKDADGCIGTCAFTLKVCPVITVSQSPSTVRVRAGATTTVTARASEGCGTHTFSDPHGLSWVSKKGGSADQYTVTPPSGTAPGEYTFNVTATDEQRNTGAGTIKVTVACPTITVRGLEDVEVTRGEDLPSMTASASGGRVGYTYRKKSGPGWVDVGTDGAISGRVPDETREYHVTVEARDASGCTGETTFKIDVIDPPLTIADIPNVEATVGQEMPARAGSASGGRPPYVYSMSGKPSWARFTTTTGRISGTPTQLGSATVTVVVDDADDRRATTSFRMTVALPGDFNGDGRRDAADAKLFNRMMGLRSSDAGYDRRMDLNGDGTINYADFVILSGYIESDAAARGNSGSGDSGGSGG